MRHLAKFLIPALLVLLSACSSNPQMVTPKLEQKGVLKVHPGLLGQPVPPELREPEEKRITRVDSTGDGQTQVVVKTAGKNDTPPSSLGSFYFDLNDAKIKPEHMNLAEEHARKLAANRKAVLRIEGHADERGPDGYNKVLGMKRAAAVKQALTSKGVKARQLKLVSYGKSRPKVKGHDESSWAENRRAELIYERE
ncbi:MAG: OmpA/MotB [Proteobacteria bacterium]|nr:OmpA/MotB [Pseudomonadota bacterium]